MRRYEPKLWELREGTLSIKTRLSATQFSLDRDRRCVHSITAA